MLKQYLLLGLIGQLILFLQLLTNPVAAKMTTSNTNINNCEYETQINRRLTIHGIAKNAKLGAIRPVRNIN
jgi:hypothetical protein